jgi:TolB-like protein/Tfp pilus assembly protein PilF
LTVQVKLNILGRFEAKLSSGECVSLPTRKAEALFTYLAIEPGPHSRDHLTSFLWSDRSEQQARNSLRQALSSLKKLFDNIEPSPLQIGRTNVDLASQLFEIDAVKLEELIIEQSPQAAAQATRLYRGEFLEGLVVRDSNGEEWLAAERDRFRRLATQALEQVPGYQLESGELDNAAVLGERLVYLDTLNESAWRILMQIYSASGDRNHALKAYKRCREILSKELGVEPSHETTKLEIAIREGSVDLLDKVDNTGTRIASEPAHAIAADIPEPTRSVEKPSIAILPFKNMSNNPEQEYFSDGITEDIITGLSRFRELFVIARGSSFAFKGLSVDVTTAAKKLGARYILEGSVRHGGERVRITAQLSDATTGNHLWAESYDRVMEDVFAVQDDVAQKIISTLVGQLEEESREQAMKKSAMNLSAYDYYLRGKHCWPNWNGTQENVLQAREMFESAMEIDPYYASAHIGLAESYLTEFESSWTTNRGAAGDRLLEHASKAVELDKRDSHAHVILACAYFYVKSNFELAEVEIQKALDLNPNDYWNYC